MAEPFCEMNPRDAAARGIGDADLVTVRTGHGTVLVRALVSSRQAPGSVFIPMHWNDQFAASARVDALVPAVTDPVSGQPASKHSAAEAVRFEAACFGFAILREKPTGLDADYWALARCEAGWRVELAFATERPDWSAFAAQLFGAEPRDECLAFHDLAAGRRRFAAFAGTNLVGALFLAREPVAVSRSWAVGQLRSQFARPQDRLAMIAGRPGQGQVDRGATVCSCFGVGVNEIAAAVRNGCHTVEAIGASLQAGTNCGSCRAEIKDIIDAGLLKAGE